MITSYRKYQTIYLNSVVVTFVNTYSENVTKKTLLGALNKGRVIMKQLIALVATIVLTFTLCTSLARAETVLIQPALMLSDSNTMYSYNKNSAGLMFVNSLPKLTPIALTLENHNDNFGFAQEQVINEHNYFFEFSIIFNDKLQQLIAFFTRDDDEYNAGDAIGNNSFAAKTSVQKCYESK